MFNNRLETLLKNNCGGHLSFVSFFTTDVDKEFAIDFVCRHLLAYPHVTGVLFEMHNNSIIRSTRSLLASLEKIYLMRQMTQQSITMCAVNLTLIADDNPQ
jgi:hypothetical protein